ncbi:hypothetical protein C8R46DRAFT_1210698 [Mycena filopes]|nr:hypothetical protein C8R46DRAFT_1210698 [Mycena filopes]
MSFKNQAEIVVGLMREIKLLISKEDGSDCTASDWVRNWKKRNLTDGALSSTYTFKALIIELESAFKDQNLAQIAHAKLTSTHQKRLLPNSFNAWNSLRSRRGLVNSEIVQQMYLGGMALPTTYQTFKERLIQIDANRQRGKIRGARQVFHTLHTPTTTTNRQPHTQGTVRNLTKPIGDEPVPMDVDVDKQRQRGRSLRCYNCGKFGHMSKECPSPPKQNFSLRELVSEIEEGDKDSELLQLLAEKLLEVL